MKIAVIDNYDSFVYNIIYMLYKCGTVNIDIYKNDKADLGQLEKYDKILLSPGPGLPKNAGIMPQVLSAYAKSKSILGICLGHQAIGENFGSSLINLSQPLHGIASEITVTKQDYLFKGLPEKFTVGHYHSWVVNPDISPGLESLATDKAGNIMALGHTDYDIRGLQFHPESVLTLHGAAILTNWINY